MVVSGPVNEATPITLRDVGEMLLELKHKTRPSTFNRALRANPTAAANFSRIKVMALRMGCASDVAALFRPNLSGHYDVSTWIETGALQDGSQDPYYAMHSPATKKNQYTTLVMISSPKKNCHALAKSVSDDTRAYFRSRLAEMAKLARKDTSSGGDKNAASLTWESIHETYRNPDSIAKLSPEERLMVEWWILGEESFPPRRYHYGELLVRKTRKPAKSTNDKDVLYVVNERATLAFADGTTVELPPELSKRIKEYIDSKGKQKWLFQSKNGTPRPLSDNAYGQQVRHAFGKLLGKKLGINSLLHLYSRRDGHA
jgi:hypothetical protein